MNLENLKLFCDVVRSRSFTRGAALNGISQSAASQAISQVEREIGAQLLDRRKRPFLLTGEGRICYEGFSEILARLDAIRADVKFVHQVVAGVIRVAAIYSVGLHDMSQTMRAFMDRHPNAKVQLEYLFPDRIYQAVLDRTVDLGIVSYPRESRDIRVLPLRSEKMVLVCHPDHHLASRQTVDLKQLQGEDFVAFEKTLPICKELDRYFRDEHISVRKVMEFDNIETVKQALEIGAGLSILPEPTVRREVESGTLAAVNLRGCDLERPLGIIYLDRKAFTPAIKRFIDTLRGRESDAPETRLAIE